MKKGFTLVELLMVVAISTLLGGIVTDFLIQMTNHNELVQAQAVIESDLALATDKFARVIRSSITIVSASSTAVTVRGYANPSDSTPSQISFYINNGAVDYSVIPASGTAPNYTYNQSDAKVYQLLSNVTNSTSLPLFNYYDDTNTLLTSPITIASVTVIEFLPSAKDANNVIKVPIVVSTKAQLRNFKQNL